jgi:ceroid-lipofuscinosis MFS transporter 7
MSLVCISVLLMLSSLFKDRERITAIAPQVKKSSRQRAVDAVANESTWFFGWTVYDAVIFGCMLLSASTKGSIACFETLGISFATSHFDLSNSRAGTIVATCGLLGVFALLSMGQIAKRLSDIQMISGGIFIMCLGAVSLADIEEGENANSWRYFISIFMIYSIGYPIGHTALIGMFSKSKYFPFGSLFCYFQNLELPSHFQY